MKNTDATPLCLGDGDNWDTGMCSVDIELEAGDYINVKVTSSGACIQGSISGQSGFLGNLMKPL